MSPKKVCVFDFDQTLAADEVTFLLDRASMVDRGFGGPERISMLRAMLTALTEHKVVLAVCSLNSRDVIRLALTSVGLSDFFEPTMIFDRSDYVRCGSLNDPPEFEGASLTTASRHFSDCQTRSAVLLSLAALRRPARLQASLTSPNT